MKITTLNKIRACSPCVESWEKLLKGLNKTQADDEPLTFKTILEVCGLDDALWATRTAPEYNREWRLLAVAFARCVQHLNPDPRVSGCLNVAERYANGQATNEELREARDAAWAAAEEAAWVAAEAAGAAAWAAAWVAAGEAAWAAGAAAGAAAWAAAWAAAEEAERKDQEKLFLEFISK